MTEVKEKPKHRKLLIVKIISVIFFLLLILMTVFSSMCPKYVPVVEVPLYSAVMILSLYWFLKSPMIKGVILRLFIASILSTATILITSQMVHSSVFPFDWFDDATKQRILERQMEAQRELMKQGS